MRLKFGLTLQGYVERVLFDPEALQQKCSELGAVIGNDYADKTSLPVAQVSTEASVLMADIIRCINVVPGG